MVQREPDSLTRDLSSDHRAGRGAHADSREWVDSDPGPDRRPRRCVRRDRARRRLDVAKAFPTHNAQARAAVANERANCESAVSSERRVAAAANERWKREVEGALADARRGHARARLHQRLREGRRYVSEGMPVGVSGVAPLGVLIDWTHRVADDLDLLGITAVQLRSGGSRSVDEGSATRDEVEAEFDRRLDVLEHLIDQRLV